MHKKKPEFFATDLKMAVLGCFKRKSTEKQQNFNLHLTFGGTNSHISYLINGLKNELVAVGVAFFLTFWVKLNHH
jgi:hypothetical protein